VKTQKELNENARKLAQAIVDAGTSSHNEAELKTSVSLALIDVARRLDLTLHNPIEKSQLSDFSEPAFRK
jgi:hypothetical protein